MIFDDILSNEVKSNWRSIDPTGETGLGLVPDAENNGSKLTQ
jgi:hypothetical protein